MSAVKNKFTLNPSWMIIIGVVLVLISYIFTSMTPAALTILQVAGIVLVVFGIILWSARFNSKRKI